MQQARATRAIAAALLVSTLVVTSAVLSACGSAGAPGTTGPTGVDGLEVPTPSPDPDDFTDRIDNPYLPLLRGSTWTYEATGHEGTQTVTVTVTDEARTVAGVGTTVVRAEVRDEDGGLVGGTDGWYAQDRAGNVWLFGSTSADAAWEAGVDGAQAGLAMPAEPRIGDGYQQGYLRGVAEGQAEVIRIDVTLELGVEAYERVVVTSDTTPLEPDVETRRYYAPGIGLVAEEIVRGGAERVELVSFTPGD